MRRFFAFLLHMFLFFFGALFTAFGIILRGAGEAIVGWLVRVVILSMLLAAFVATIEFGLKPITLQNLMCVFLGMNFIAVMLYESRKNDKWLKELSETEIAEINIFDKILESTEGLSNKLMGIETEKLKNEAKGQVAKENLALLEDDSEESELGTELANQALKVVM